MSELKATPATASELYAALVLILPLAKGYRPARQSESARKTCREWIEIAKALKDRGEPS